MTIGWLTLDVGDEALIYDVEGRGRVEEGPKRIFLFREKSTILSRYSANQNEYLRVKFNSGRIEHISGPCAMYKNPMKHQTVERLQGIPLDANELLVVYRQDEKSKEISRRLQYGPTVFMPTASEWLHEFLWHGCDPVSKTNIQPKRRQFTKLQVIPDQFYYNVDEVRTSDDAVIKVKLMIFYELHSVERMLETTLDPIGDFINCVCADVVSFASKLTYMEFMEESDKLNRMESYPTLLECCTKIGYVCTKIVFRGYFASDKLQKIHDNAMDSRTKLRIQKETEEQSQSLIDMKLRAEMERLEAEQSLQLQETQHKHRIESLQLDHKLELAAKDTEAKIINLKLQHEARLAAKKAENEAKLAELRRLKSLGVNLDTYLRSQFDEQTKITHIFGQGNQTGLHLHRS